MADDRARKGLRAVAVSVGVLAIAVVLVLRAGTRLPDGPVAVHWDEDTCAECRMHVGDPRFAAQLQTRDGEVLQFDDVGCLFVYLDRVRPDVHAIYVRDSTADRWLRRGDAAFVPARETPMGYGLAAMPRDRAKADALAFDAARRSVGRAARGGEDR